MWIHEIAHRESPRILANRIFLAFGDSAPAYRLRRNRPLTGKMLGKNPRAGFSIVLNLSFFIRCAESDCGVDSESGRPQLSKPKVCELARGGISYFLRPIFVSNRTYAVLVWIQFGKEFVGCGNLRKKPTANRHTLKAKSFSAEVFEVWFPIFMY